VGVTYLSLSSLDCVFFVSPFCAVQTDKTYARRFEDLHHLLCSPSSAAPSAQNHHSSLDSLSDHPLMRWYRTNPAFKTLIEALITADSTAHAAASAAAAAAIAVTPPPAPSLPSTPSPADSKASSSSSSSSSSSAAAKDSKAPPPTSAAAASSAAASAPAPAAAAVSDVSRNIHVEVAFIEALFAAASHHFHSVTLPALVQGSASASLSEPAVDDATLSLFSIHRQLLSRALTPLTHADAVRAPLLLSQFTRVFASAALNLVQSVMQHISVAAAAADQKPVVASSLWRRSFVGALLPTFCVGYAVVSSAVVLPSPGICYAVSCHRLT
jgi:hypothetical protein